MRNDVGFASEYWASWLHSHRIKNANSHQISTSNLVFVKYFIKTQNDKQIKGSLFFQRPSVGIHVTPEAKMARAKMAGERSI